MSTEILCPDCGKVIAARDAVTDESVRCRCAEKARAAPTPQNKICFVCGVDLGGRARLKDPLGRYWCKNCAKADRRVQRGMKKRRCPDCNRMFPPAKFVKYDEVKLCVGCRDARKKAAMRALKKVGIENAHRRYEFRPVKVMAVILVILVILALVQLYFRYA